MGRRRHETFETDYPAVDDFEFRNLVFDEQVLRRFRDIAGEKGVLKGNANELEVYAADPGQTVNVQVKTGVAHILGERAEVLTEQDVALDDVETEANIISIDHVAVQDTDGRALRNDSTGTPHVVWYSDSYALEATPESEWTNPSTKLALARVSWDPGEGALVVEDLREYTEQQLPLADDTVPTAAIQDDAVTAAKIADGAVLSAALHSAAVTESKIATIAVTEAKIGTGAVAETKLKAGTHLGPVFSHSEIQADAANAVDPAAIGTAWETAAGTTKYKMVTLFSRLSVDGPCRQLRLDFIAGANIEYVFLVAWPAANPPPQYDPTDPEFDGEVNADYTNGATGARSVLLDITGRAGTGLWVVGVVMMAQAGGDAAAMTNAVVSAVR